MTLTPQGHRPEHIFEEKERIGKLSQIRELIFGAQDGLLVPLGVVSSVAGAFLNNHFVIVAGVAEGLAGAFSMATGAYLASQAEAQVYKAEIAKELAAIDRDPAVEREEMILFYESEGVPRESSVALVDHMLTSKKAFANTMIQKELGLEPNPPGTPLGDSVYVGVSYLFNAAIPLLPYFFIPAAKAIPVSIGLTLLALFSLGLIKARVASLNYLKSGFQILLVGACSGLGGYLLGSVLPHILGIK